MATEFKEASAPDLSRPDIGLAPGARGSPCFRPSGGVAGLFAVHHVGSDGEDGQGVPGLAVQAVLAQSVVELLRLLASDLRPPGRRRVAEAGKSPSISKSVTRPVSGSRMQRTLAYFTAERGSAMQLMPAMPKGHQTAHRAVVEGHLALS